MSAIPAQTAISVINSTDALQGLLDDLNNLPTNPPSLYLDLEGVNLSRHGSIYLIGIHRLGATAFSTASNKNSSGTATTTSLKIILETSTIPKVIFDIRNDSDALFNLFGISVDGFKDL
ncbi:hypothetical protein AJ80_05231 [Polytolypa hystricis UAMH7299]|uniref:3'-5' exonuclease domain-containing protein n=1 Tax=Polytolypa hystricis (strain UAMH7299) TaxID=1447883 RepID=A0A2B7Y5V2_POLH7|nr:hypothetical protein AJ80_05231 [Polytolypa hystricis UAMH7299]